MPAAMQASPDQPDGGRRRQGRGTSLEPFVERQRQHHEQEAEEHIRDQVGQGRDGLVVREDGHPVCGVDALFVVAGGGQHAEKHDEAHDPGGRHGRCRNAAYLVQAVHRVAFPV
jgi:hypothetical protein